MNGVGSLAGAFGGEFEFADGGAEFGAEGVERLESGVGGAEHGVGFCESEVEGERRFLEGGGGLAEILERLLQILDVFVVQDLLVDGGRQVLDFFQALAELVHDERPAHGEFIESSRTAALDDFAGLPKISGVDLGCRHHIDVFVSQ